ncbi:MAG: DMT family transporter [Synechococcaceae cyanobacterium SM2_3_2]|nr:DMT family transporter [Synechococcaceae cyanobacterium SM2_3_2]
MKSSPRAPIYAAIAILGWSTAATAFKLGLGSIDPPHLLLIASGISELVLVGILTIRGQLGLLWRQTWAEMALSALQGSLNPCGYYLILFWAYSRLSAQAAMALNYTWPLALALLAVPLLGEPLRLKTLFAIAISLLGVLLIATGGHWNSLTGQDPVGVGLAVGSATIWGLYWLLNVRDPRPAEIKLCLAFGFGTLYTALLLPSLSDPTWPPLEGWLAGSYIGMMEMGLAFVCWLRALELTSHRGSLATAVYLAPFASLFWIWLILGESIALASVAGLALILASVLWQSRPNLACKR